jgi:hypothetical protein
VYDEDLENLESGLRRLKVEYHIYQSGSRKKPPDDLRIRVERLVKKLSESSDMSFSQHFRFSTLVTRYYAYKDRWRREAQNREMDLASRRKPMPETVAPAPSSQAPAEAIRISISDPKSEEEKVRQLYDVLIHLKRKETPETHLSYAQFAKYIAAQTLGLKKKYGCARVAFTIALDEDALRFTATTDDLQEPVG